jgi:hypothetical protein
MTDNPDIFDVPPLAQHGGRRTGAGRPRRGEIRPKKQPKPQDKGTAYVIGRLKRDAALGVKAAALLLSGISAGLITPHQAALEMNFRQRREPSGRARSENVTRSKDWAMHKLMRQLYAKPPIE